MSHLREDFAKAQPLHTDSSMTSVPKEPSNDDVWNLLDAGMFSDESDEDESKSEKMAEDEAVAKPAPVKKLGSLKSRSTTKKAQRQQSRTLASPKRKRRKVAAPPSQPRSTEEEEEEDDDEEEMMPPESDRASTLASIGYQGAMKKKKRPSGKSGKSKTLNRTAMQKTLQALAVFFCNTVVEKNKGKEAMVGVEPSSYLRAMEYWKWLKFPTAKILDITGHPLHQCPEANEDPTLAWKWLCAQNDRKTMVAIFNCLYQMFSTPGLKIDGCTTHADFFCDGSVKTAPQFFAPE